MAVIAGRYETVGDPEWTSTFELQIARAPDGRLVEVVRTEWCDADELDTFRDDVRALEQAARDHAHLVPVLDAGVEHDESRGYCVLPAREGTSVLEVREAGPLPVPLGVGLRIAADTARGLDHLAEGGIVPQMFDLARIEITADGAVRVRPFPLRFMPSRHHDVAGVPSRSMLDYVSPEGMKGSALGPASCVFSVCVLAYELLSGRHPYRREGLFEMVRRLLLEGPLPPPTQFAPTFPPALEALVMRGLETKPELRPSGCGVLAAELDAIADARRAWVAQDELAAFVRERLAAAGGGSP